MAEIIDLVSSSPPQSQAGRTGISSSLLDKTPPKVTSNKLFEFDISELDSPANVDVEVEQQQPAKKRRLSPPRGLPVQQPLSHRTASGSIFQLSSDGDLLPSLSQHVSKPTSAVVTEEIFELGDDGTAEEEPNLFRFSSSAPELAQNLGPSAELVATKDYSILELSSDDDDNVNAHDPIQSSSQPILSETTSRLLAKLGTATNGARQKQAKHRVPRRPMSEDVETSRTTKFKSVTKSSITNRDEIIDSSQPVRGSKKGPGPLDSGVNASDSAVSKKLSKAERDAVKEAEKERKRLEREQKARDKQQAADIAEVNKSRTNKKISTPEMMVDMPSSLHGSSVGNQVEEYMRQLNVQVTFSQDDEINLTSATGVTAGNIIRWRRKVTADYDEDLEIWKPLPQPRVTRENHLLVYLKAEEFISLAVVGLNSSATAPVTDASKMSESAMRSNLDGHVKSLRARHPDCTLIYLIEGLAAWHRKSLTAKNRAYTAAVRSQVLEDTEGNEPPTTTVAAAAAAAASSSTQAQSSSSSSRSRTKPGKRKNTSSTSTPTTTSNLTTIITPDTTETLLLHLQLTHPPLLIHQTTSPAATSSQITTFTQHLSTRPYRLTEQSHNLSSASFCMTTGQIRTGATPHEVYINMLQEVNRVTPSMAYGVSGAGYARVTSLVRGFRAGGNLLLEDVRKSVNRDGGWSDRRLGPMVSRRLYKVFMGRDPAARDGMA